MISADIASTECVVIFGGTDTTIALATAVQEVGLNIAAIVTVGATFTASYKSGLINSSRYANLTDWCAENRLEAIPFTTYEGVLARLNGRKATLGLVAGWYHVIPSAIRKYFSRGCIGFHASLLPKLRGG